MDKPTCSCGSCCQAAIAAGNEAAAIGGAALATSVFAIEGLDCADCAAKLEKGLRRIAGVADVKVNFVAATLQIAYDGNRVQPDSLAAAIRGLGYEASLQPMNKQQTGPRKMVFRLAGLDCADCAAKLEKKIAGLPGVRSVAVNFASGKMTVEGTLSEAELIQAVEQAGYKAEPAAGAKPAGQSPPAKWRTSARTLATLASGLMIACAFLLEWSGAGSSVLVPLYAAAMAVGGYHVAKSGLYSLRALVLDMNVLMTVAVVGAAAIGEWSEGAMVAFLFSFGNMLQSYTIDRTRRAIRSLMDLAPPEALVRRGNEEQRLPVEDIVVGDIILVKPGERIAMDGVVQSGCSSVNEAPITGESLPVEKEAGDKAYAGTINQNGLLEIRVTRVAADSTLAKIMHLVEEAQAQKAPSQQFVDVFSRYYTPVVLLGAVAVMLLPTLLAGQPFEAWFYKGLVLLVISCPCALVISTPVSIVAAIGNASRQGVLVKGGAYLEAVGSLQAVAFDKTGTLTYGRPEVTDVVPLAGQSREDLLVTAASVERWSEHPLAAAVVGAASGLELKPVSDFAALVGRGAQAVVGAETVYVGNTRLFEELGHSLAAYQERLSTLEGQGKTVMLVGGREAVYGLIAVADILREESGEAVRSLRRSGLSHIAMLTGDNRQVAGAIAAKLNLDAYYSELLPEDKVAAIQKIIREHGSVAMIGDGVNDAPALATASVGIAMGVAGSDAALETADVALMSDDLNKLAYLITLSRKTVAVIKQNIAFAVIVKALFLVLTMAGWANLWLAVFADTGTSILVTLNGMRLMRRLG